MLFEHRGGIGQRRQEALGERAPDDRRPAHGRPILLGETIEAGHQQPDQRGREGHRGEIGGEPPGTGPRDEQAPLPESLDRLGQEERIVAALRDDLRRQRVVQGRFGEEAAQKFATLRGGQFGQRDLAIEGASGPGVRPVGAIGQDDQERRGRDRIDKFAEDLDAGAVRPVQFFEHQDERTPLVPPGQALARADQVPHGQRQQRAPQARVAAGGKGFWRAHAQ